MKSRRRNLLPTPYDHDRTNRRGAFMIVVVVALVVMLMVIGSLLRVVIVHGRQAGRNAQQAQAVWLAESGLERAANRLTRDVTYERETWKIDLSRLRGGTGGIVEIRVEKVEGAEEERRVFVEAYYPETGLDRVRAARQATIHLWKDN